MKNSPRKLVVRREILRALDTMDLSRAIGGLDSGAQPCAVAADSGAFQCPAPGVLITKAACG